MLRAVPLLTCSVTGGGAMYRSICLGFAALMLPGAGLATPLELEPSSKWNLSYDMEACRLSRAFGEGDEKIVTHFIRYMPDPGFEVIVWGKLLKPQGKEFEYRFAPGDEAGVAQNLLFSRGDDGMTVWQFNSGLIPHAEFEKLDKGDTGYRQVAIAREEERAKEVRSFEILNGVKQPVSLQIGPLEKAMQAMDTCMDDLVREWGYDPVVRRGLISAPQPIGNPGLWITADDYPSKALRDRLSGIVRFRVDVDETGAVDGCIIQQALSSPAFREPTCKLIEKRARFAPAVGADGKPVRSYWGTSVEFATW